MRKGPQQRMFFSGVAVPSPVVLANPDGPFSAPIGFPTTVLGTTLLANDIFPITGVTIIGVSAFVNGAAVLIGQDVQWTQAGPGPGSFDYTIQDNIFPAVQSTATVTMSGIVAVPPTAPPPFAVGPYEEQHTASLAKTDLLVGATYTNPVTITVLDQDNPAYGVMFDSDIPGPWPFIISGPPLGQGQYLFLVPPGVNSLEIECHGAEGGKGGDNTATGALPPPLATGHPGGLGGSRIISNVKVSPGDILTLAVGGQGGPGANLVAVGVGHNTGGGTQGFGHANTPPTGFDVRIVGSGFWVYPDFYFPEGLTSSGTNLPGQQGGYGQHTKAIPGPNPTIVSAGGGGGAGSAVYLGDHTTPPRAPGIILCAAGGGGGGGGRPDPPGPPEQLPGRPGGLAVSVNTGRGPVAQGDPSLRSLGGNAAVFAVPGAGATHNGRGGGGGGYKGGLAASSTAGFPYSYQALGGENGDRRVFTTQNIFGPSTDIREIQALSQFYVPPSNPVWTYFARTTTVETEGTRVGDGRVVIRGRFTQDQLAGQQVPDNCGVSDPNPAWDSSQPDDFLRVTPQAYLHNIGTAPDTSSFYYYLTDTVTSLTSGVTQVTVDTDHHPWSAVDDPGYYVTENLTNQLVDSVANLVANDTIFGETVGPPANPVVIIESFAGNISNPVIVGGNLYVDTGPVAGGNGTVTYRITDVNALNVLGPVPGTGVDGQVFPTSTDTAIVTINVVTPTPVAVDDDLGGVIALPEKAGAPPAPTITIPKSTLIANDIVGSYTPATIETFTLVGFTNCELDPGQPPDATNIYVRATVTAVTGDATFRYKVRNSLGTDSPNEATVTIPIFADSFLGCTNTDDAGTPDEGHVDVPEFATLMKVEVWGAAGADAIGGPGLGGNGQSYSLVANVTPGQIIEYAEGQMGTQGALSTPGVPGAKGLGGTIDVSGTSLSPLSNPADGFFLSGSCPLVLDAGPPPATPGTPVGGDGSQGVAGGIDGAAGGGAGSVVWRGEDPTNNIVAAVGGGGGAGGFFANGNVGGTPGDALSCSARGRSMDIPGGNKGLGGGGGGFRGGDRTDSTPNDTGGPGGGAGYSGGAGVIVGTENSGIVSTRRKGRVKICFDVQGTVQWRGPRSGETGYDPPDSWGLQYTPPAGGGPAFNYTFGGRVGSRRNNTPPAHNTWHVATIICPFGHNVRLFSTIHRAKLTGMLTSQNQASPGFLAFTNSVVLPPGPGPLPWSLWSGPGSFLASLSFAQPAVSFAIGQVNDEMDITSLIQEFVGPPGLNPLNLTTSGIRLYWVIAAPADPPSGWQANTMFQQRMFDEQPYITNPQWWPYPDTDRSRPFITLDYTPSL